MILNVQLCSAHIQLHAVHFLSFQLAIGTLFCCAGCGHVLDKYCSDVLDPSNQNHQSEKTDQSEKPDQSKKTDQSEKPDQSEKTDHAI